MTTYNNGESYQQVLQALFGAKQSATVKSHKKAIHFNNILN